MTKIPKLSVCDLQLLITPLVFWSLYYLSVDLLLLISPLAFRSLYCLFMIYGFWLLLWYFGHCIVCLWFTAFDYSFGILLIVLSVCDLRLLITPLVFWSLYCLSFDLRFWLPPLVFWSLYCLSVIYSFWLPLWYFGHCIVCLWFTAFDYSFGILVIVLSVCDLLLLTTHFVFWSLYCLSVIYGFWLPLWYFGHCIVCFLI
jgi:hypothetical protein